MTTYNITPAGQVINTNGVLSNFSSSNYAYINKVLTPSSNYWHLEFDINITNSAFSASQYFLCSEEYGFGIGITSSNKLRMYYGNGSSWTSFNDSTATVSAGKYTIGCGWTGSTYYVNLKTSAGWQKSVCTASSSVTASTLTFKFGVAKANDAPFINGTVDINNAVLLVSNSEFWTGKAWDIPTYPDTKYSWDILKVGSLTNNDEVYSNFSSSNYLEMKTHPSTAINSLEMGISFTTSSSISNSIILGQSSGNLNTPQFEVYNGELCLDFTSDGSYWQSIIRTPVICKNTNYLLNIAWDSSTQKINANLTNMDTGFVSTFAPLSTGTALVNAIYWISNIRLGVDVTSSPWLGSIDLNNSYIKVNGSLYPDITEQSSFSPNIEIGSDSLIRCYSGNDFINRLYFGDVLLYQGVEPTPGPGNWDTTFQWARAQITGTNYQEVTNQSIPADKDIECVLKLVFNNATFQSGSNVILHTGSYWNIFNTQWINGTSKHPLIDGSPWTGEQLTGMTINPTSDTIYTKYTVQGTTAWYGASRDKSTWTSVSATKSRSAASISMWFMRHASNSYPAPTGCFIDTTESYIKVDGKYMVRPYGS